MDRDGSQLGDRTIRKKIHSSEAEQGKRMHREMPAITAELTQQASVKEKQSKSVGERSREGGTSAMEARNSLSQGNPEDVTHSSGAIHLCSVLLPSLQQSLETQIQQTAENSKKRW